MNEQQLDMIGTVFVEDLGMTNDVDASDFEGRRIIAFTSGGNDSVALVRWLHEAGFKDVTAVFSDTGWAADWWIERILDFSLMCDRYGYGFEVTKSIGMEALVRSKKAWPPNGPFQFCTQYLKVIPAQLWLQENDPNKEAVCAVGIRREENAVTRGAYSKLMRSSPDHGGRSRWAPLAEYGEEARNQLIERSQMSILPHSSFECFPCIPNANKAELSALPESRVEEIEAIEKTMGRTSNGKPRTAFRPARHQGAIGVRNVVRWAKGEEFEVDPDYDRDNPPAELPMDDCKTGWCRQ